MTESWESCSRRKMADMLKRIEEELRRREPRTVKGHNSHIYSKLGVDSYDSLKAYLDVLRRCERLEELLQGGGK